MIIAIHTSKIGIDIKNLIIDTDAEEKINEDGKIYVYLLLFNKIKLFRKNVRCEIWNKWFWYKDF